jgi:hypothetical protein
MLPRNKLRNFAMLMAPVFVAGLLMGSPVQAIRYAPDVSYQELTATSNLRTVTANQVVTEIQPVKVVSRFTLIGITWLGYADPTSEFQVRIREKGKWLDWQDLTWSQEHGADETSIEEANARSGTDPLISAPADAVAARVINKSGSIPADIRIVLSNSEQTQQDRNLISPRSLNSDVPVSVTSPQGAVVARPNFITRAQWGATESWRNQDPAVGTKIIAGFMHHTASTNSYAADEGPAQMRILYAYYTKGLKYKDLAYSFLVDRYGNIYEGRSGCPRTITTPCDGPAIPAVGAHTAGMNLNTFAVSVIGNYQTTKPPASNLASIVESVAAVMAWKIAPYGLDPNGISNVPVGADPKNHSRYSEGEIAHITTISGHRDVGRTVCPGQYLYPSLPVIRERISNLLKPVVRDANVTPSAVEVSSGDAINFSLFAPANADWQIRVTDQAGGAEYFSTSGTAETAGTISATWDRMLADAQPLPAGRYVAKFSLIIDGATLPIVNKAFFVGTIPVAPEIISNSYLSKRRQTIKFVSDASFGTITYKYRTYSYASRKWSVWKISKNTSDSAIITGLRSLGSYKLQIRSQNKLGISATTTYRFRHRK